MSHVNRKCSCYSCWRRVLIFVPLMILIGDRLIGTLRIIQLPSRFDPSPSTLVSEEVGMIRLKTLLLSNYNYEKPKRQSFPSLQELTRISNTSAMTTTTTTTTVCPQQGTRRGNRFVFINNRISNVTDASTNGTHHYQIPRIIHQTSKSRCLTKRLAHAVQQWTPLVEQGGWSYYFHDDEAVAHLFSLDYPEFPLLKLVTQHCLKFGTVQADVWRYLVLYVYGGIYADLDTHPNYDTFLPTGTAIEPDMQGFFVVEQYHILSQYFMAMAPRHPLMYYAIQHSLLKLYGLTNTYQVYAPAMTGPQALHMAYREFRRDAGVLVPPTDPGEKPVWSGTFVGTYNTTITVVGQGRKETEWIIREAVKLPMKKAEYSLMGMTHFKDHHSIRGIENVTSLGRSCIHAMLPSQSQFLLPPLPLPLPLPLPPLI